LVGRCAVAPVVAAVVGRNGRRSGLAGISLPDVADAVRKSVIRQQRGAMAQSLLSGKKQSVVASRSAQISTGDHCVVLTLCRVLKIKTAALVRVVGGGADRIGYGDARGARDRARSGSKEDGRIQIGFGDQM